ncbi:protein-tyrosine phosphatase [Meredithblackwellia eburnea MCA 4105]
MSLTLGPFELSGETLIPPLNFAVVLPQVYRSGFPNKKNFPFMDSLNLRSIVCLYLGKDDYKRDTYEWAQSRGLNIFHQRINSCEDLDGEDAFVEALEVVLVLIHDNKGRFLPSIIMALLRLLQRWSFTSVLAEYRAFLPDEKIWAEGMVGKPEKGRERVADIEFIDRFPLERVTFLPEFKPKWLE